MFNVRVVLVVKYAVEQHERWKMRDWKMTHLIAGLEKQ